MLLLPLCLLFSGAWGDSVRAWRLVAHCTQSGPYRCCHPQLRQHSKLPKGNACDSNRALRTDIECCAKAQHLSQAMSDYCLCCNTSVFHLHCNTIISIHSVLDTTPYTLSTSILACKCGAAGRIALHKLHSFSMYDRLT